MRRYKIVHEEMDATGRADQIENHGNFEQHHLFQSAHLSSPVEIVDESNEYDPSTFDYRMEEQSLDRIPSVREIVTTIESKLLVKGGSDEKEFEIAYKDDIEIADYEGLEIENQDDVEIANYEDIELVNQDDGETADNEELETEKQDDGEMTNNEVGEIANKEDEEIENADIVETNYDTNKANESGEISQNENDNERDENQEGKIDEDMWERHLTEEGIEYWFNPRSGVSEWMHPFQNPENAKLPIDKAEIDFPLEEEESFYMDALAAISKLHDAVHANRIREIKVLIAAGISINACNGQGYTPIFYTNTKETLELLLEYDVDLFVTNHEESLIHHFVRTGKAIELLKIVLRSICGPGATFPSNFHLFDSDGNTPLHAAILTDDLNYVNELKYFQCHIMKDIKYLIEVPNSDLISCVEFAKSFDIKACIESVHWKMEADRWKLYAMELEKGQKPILKRLELAEHRYQELYQQHQIVTASHEGLQHRNHDLEQELELRTHEVDDLVTQLNSVTQTNSNFEMPENYDIQNDESRWNENGEIVVKKWKMILNGDGEKYFHNQETDETQWDRPEEYEEVDPAKISQVWLKFFEKSAVASLNRQGDSPMQNPDQLLITGIDLMDPMMVEQGLSMGASCSDDMSDGSELETMLHRCCAIDCNSDKLKCKRVTEIAALLIKYGSDVNVKSSRGVTPVHVACSVGNILLLELLLTFQADVDALDGNDDSPLHYAATGGSKGHFKCVHLLTRYGAELRQPNKQGNTPLECARIQMVLAEYPGKPLCQVVDLLQKLNKLVGDDKNPFADRDADDNFGRIEEVLQPTDGWWQSFKGAGWFASNEENEEGKNQTKEIDDLS